jgi:hypothetical protein
MMSETSQEDVVDVCACTHTLKSHKSSPLETDLPCELCDCKNYWWKVPSHD